MSAMRTVQEWRNIIPRLEDLPHAPKRIILHWTGGTYEPNDIEREHYHYLVDGEAAIHVGRYSVADNMRRLKPGDSYAAHTRGFNSFSVGVAFCGMRGATPNRNFGPYPLKREQVERGLEFVALALWTWGLNPLNPAHLFTHYEAEVLHGVDQLPVGEGTWKWDITELEFEPDLEPHEVGDWIRLQVYRSTEAVVRQLLPEPEIKLV